MKILMRGGAAGSRSNGGGRQGCGRGGGGVTASDHRMQIPVIVHGLSIFSNPFFVQKLSLRLLLAGATQREWGRDEQTRRWLFFLAKIQLGEGEWEGEEKEFGISFPFSFFSNPRLYLLSCVLCAHRWVSDTTFTKGLTLSQCQRCLFFPKRKKYCKWRC